VDKVDDVNGSKIPESAEIEVSQMNRQMGETHSTAQPNVQTVPRVLSFYL